MWPPNANWNSGGGQRSVRPQSSLSLCWCWFPQPRGDDKGGEGEQGQNLHVNQTISIEVVVVRHHLCAGVGVGVGVDSCVRARACMGHWEPNDARGETKDAPRTGIRRDTPLDADTTSADIEHKTQGKAILCSAERVLKCHVHQTQTSICVDNTYLYAATYAMHMWYSYPSAPTRWTNTGCTMARRARDPLQLRAGAMSNGY